MGLFSNNKKLCPICGSPTPRFLATKFENEAICKDCDNKIDLPDGVQGKMTLAGRSMSSRMFGTGKQFFTCSHPTGGFVFLMRAHRPLCAPPPTG